MVSRLQRASQARKRIRDLQQRERELLDALLSCRHLVKGSVYELLTRCGKPNCSCSQGAPHAAMVLSWSQEGRTKLMTVGPGDLDRLLRLTGEYKKFRQARASLVKLQRELLKVVDRLEAVILEAAIKKGRE